jgi:anti-sigma factor RsiW
MHQEIRHSLEDFLRGDNHSELPAEFQAHLGECPECADELRLLEAQSQLLRSLGSGVEVEPRAGFYARVVERIQAQPVSIWSVFLERRFGFRLAVASAALVALLATYLVTSEANGPEFASSPKSAFTTNSQTVGDSQAAGSSATGSSVAGNSAAESSAAGTLDDGLRQQQQRNAVLVDLASYRQ